MVNFTPSVGQNFITNGFFEVKYQPLRAERKTKSRPFNSKTLPEQLLNSLEIIFRKSKNGFLVIKIWQITPSEDQNMTNKIDFGDHISTFRGENKPESCPFKAKNKP